MKKDIDFETHMIRMPSLSAEGEPVTLQLFSEGGVLAASAICVGESCSVTKAYDLPIELLEYALVGAIKFCSLDPIP